MFFVLFFIFILAGFVISLKILAGYNPEFSFRIKALIATGLFLCWFSPLSAMVIRFGLKISSAFAVVLEKTAFSAFVFGFFLMMTLLIRDIFWIHGNQILKLLKKNNSDYDPMNPKAIVKANVAAVLFAGILSGYALYQGLKIPDVKETAIYSDKVKNPFKIAVLSDLHITRATPLFRIKAIVDKTNALKPDIIVLVGDIVDAKPAQIEPQMDELAKLKADKSVFVTLGNHEFYIGSWDWETKFRKMGLSYMGNHAVLFESENVYLTGIPDPHFFRPKEIVWDSISKTLAKNTFGAYSVLLSHSPSAVENVDAKSVDLQISGHTHGGQIFPFHLLVKRFNGFVSGLYDVKGFKLYVSNGAGGWGPPMRLFAPSEISLITLLPEKTTNSKTN